MDVVNIYDQHRVMGSGFSNVTDIKKWHKMYSLGIDDFHFLLGFYTLYM